MIVTKTKTHYALTLGAIITALAFLGNADATEQEREQERYCQMVAEGAWPAYRGLDGCE